MIWNPPESWPSGSSPWAKRPRLRRRLRELYNLLGFDWFGTGQLAAARYHFERAIELFGAGPSDYDGAYFAQHAGNVLVGVPLILGYPSIALSKADALLSTARRGSDPNSVAAHLFSYGMHHLLRRDTRMVAERADELLSIAYC